MVMLEVNGGAGSVRSLIFLCVLSIYLSVGSCGSCDVEEFCVISKLDCSLGEGIVLLFVVMASCVSGALV